MDEEIKAAMEAEDKANAAPVEESAPSEEVVEEAVAQTEEGEEAAPEEPEKPKHDPVQKRINEITAKRYAAEREAKELRERLDALERSGQTKAKAPTLEDFDYDDQAYLNARVEYEANLKLSELREKERQSVKQAEQQKAAAEFKKKVEASGIADYDDVVQGLTQTFTLPGEIVEAILTDEKGPELAYYLGKHLDVAERIISMPPVKAAIELGRIAANIAGEGKKPVKVSKAPEPVKPLKSGGSSKKSFEDMTVEELQKALG